MPMTGNQSLRQNLHQEFHKIILPQAATVNAVQSFSNDSHPSVGPLEKKSSPHAIRKTVNNLRITSE